MKNILYILLFVLIGFACGNKKKKDPVIISPTPPIVAPIEEAKCEEIPPEPQPFGWRDSVGNKDESVLAFMYNPVAPNEIICVVNSSGEGDNRMFTYNVISKEKNHLAFIGNYLPSLNKGGWLAFNTIDNNIFIIKTNGDSLQQITNNYHCVCPQWDNSGKAIYYFQEAYSTVFAGVVKINIVGAPNTYIVPANMAHHATFKKSDQIVYLRSENSKVSIIQRDMVTHFEQVLITGPSHGKNEKIHFANLCIDNNDQNMYWCNKLGVFRCHLSSLKIDTLLKNCPNYTYNNLLMSFKDNELTMNKHIIKPLSSFVLFHQYKAMQLNLLNQNLSEVRIFP